MNEVDAVICEPDPDTGYFIVEMRLCGCAVPAIIDTGSSCLVMSRDVCLQLQPGLEVALNAAKPIAEAVGIAGVSTEARMVRVKKVSIGPYTLRDVDCMVVDCKLHDEKQADVPILGMQALRQLKLLFDGDRLEITQ